MKKIVIILIAFAFITGSCSERASKKATTSTIDSVENIWEDKEKDENLEDIHNICFSKADIACQSGDGNGLYGKFPLKQMWTLVSLYRNKIITAETMSHYFDFMENLTTSFVEQGKELTFRFDIAFKGIYSEKDIEILPLIIENDADIINKIKQNIPVDISAKEFWKKQNPEYKMEPFEITNIQLYSYTNNENKFWIAYCNFQFVNSENSQEYTGLVGVTADKEIVLLSGYCVVENSVYVLRLKDKFLLYVVNDTCGEGAILTTRLYKLSANFEKFFEETIGYD